MELIVPELAKQYGVTEQLKAENQMEWVRQMNACKAQAEEIVKFELIYDWYWERPDEKCSGAQTLEQTVTFSRSLLTKAPSMSIISSAT